MATMVQRFQESSGISVESTLLSWGNPYYTKLSLAASSGRPPDVAVAHLSRLPLLAQAGLLEPVGEQFSSAGITDDVPSFLLPRVSFGSHSLKSITAIALNLDTINEASGFEQAGILGGNFLRNYRMTFDFKKSKVTFVPINEEP